MNDREALKLALEALEVATTPLARDRQEVLRAQAALREALAEQPAQQEPVAWAHKEGLESIKNFDASIYANGGFDDAVPLYTSPPAQREWQGLTDEEIESEWSNVNYAKTWAIYRIDIVRAIEAKLKEKNT